MSLRNESELSARTHCRNPDYFHPLFKRAQAKVSLGLRDNRINAYITDEEIRISDELKNIGGIDRLSPRIRKDITKSVQIFDEAKRNGDDESIGKVAEEINKRLLGIDGIIFERVSSRLETQNRSDAIRLTEGSIPKNEIVDLARSAALEAVNPQNWLTSKGRDKIKLNLIKAGYATDEAEQAVKQLVISGALTAGAFLGMQGISHGLILAGAHEAAFVPNIPNSEALIGILVSYGILSIPVCVMPGAQHRSIQATGINTEVTANALSKLLKYFNPDVTDEGEVINNTKKQELAVKLAIWAPHIAKGVYSVMWGTIAPQPVIQAHYVGAGIKTLEAGMLYGYSRRAEGRPFFPTREETKIFVKSKIQKLRK